MPKLRTLKLNIQKRKAKQKAGAQSQSKGKNISKKQTTIKNTHEDISRLNPTELREWRLQFFINIFNKQMSEKKPSSDKKQSIKKKTKKTK